MPSCEAAGMKRSRSQPKCARCYDDVPAGPALRPAPQAAGVAAQVATLLDVLSAAQPAAYELAARLLAPEAPGCNWAPDRFAAPRSARLVCRQLRDVLDRCIPKLRLVVDSLEERRRWEAGRAPSLARWPGCSAVVLHIGEGAYPEDDPADMAAAAGMSALGAMLVLRQGLPTAAVGMAAQAAMHFLQEGLLPATAAVMATLLAMPFMQRNLPVAPQPAAAQPAAAQPRSSSQPAAAPPGLWPRITRLELLLSPCALPPNVFASVLPLLPQLKELVLKYELAEAAGDHALAQHQRMYDALSALPLLESLTLPGGGGLGRLAELPCSGRLQVLEVQCGQSVDWTAAAVGISGLQQLRELRLDASPLLEDDELKGFRALLRRLPPTLLLLTLGLHRDSQQLGVMTAALREGRALRLGVELTSGSCTALYGFANRLRGWPALGPPQRQQLLISLDCLTLTRETDDDDPLWWLEEAPVEELLCCLRVELGKLRVEAHVAKWVVLRAMELLGKPRRLVLQCGPTERATLDIRGAAEEPEPPATAAAAMPPHLPPQQWRRRKAEQQGLRLMGKVLRRTFAASRADPQDEPQPPMSHAQQALQQFWDKRLMVGAEAGLGNGESSASSSSDGEGGADDPDDLNDGAAPAVSEGAGGLDERARLAVMLRLWKKLAYK